MCRRSASLPTHSWSSAIAAPRSLARSSPIRARILSPAVDPSPALPRHARTAAAFDGQAAAFERAPIQTDPRLLTGLVAFADLPAGTRVLDAGCGPGLVAEAFLSDPRGYRLLGCDLSGEMVARASRRCAFGLDR